MKVDKRIVALVMGLIVVAGCMGELPPEEENQTVSGVPGIRVVNELSQTTTSICGQSMVWSDLEHRCVCIPRDLPTSPCGQESCVYLDTDPENCGACGNVCEAGEVCNNGSCGVP